MVHGAPIGNQYRLELDTPEIRQIVYMDFCAHLAKGKAIKSWYYDKDGYLISWQAFLGYLDRFKSELNPIHKINAESKGYQEWETITEDSAKGKNKRANTASLQMVMRNKFGWDKQENKTLAPGSYTINVTSDGLAAGLPAKTIPTPDNQSSE